MKNERKPKDRSPSEKLKLLMDYENLPSEKRGEFLRKNSIHEDHLRDWKQQIEEALSSPKQKTNRSELQAEQKKTKQLEKELRRKVNNISRDKIVLHSDNGGPMKGATMLATLQRLGIAPSFSRPKVSDDNPFSESLFKTLKYWPSFPERGFKTIAEAEKWVTAFVNWYNNNHLHIGINFVTPSSRHSGADREILEKKIKVYQKAKLKNPNRWSRQHRNWKQVGEVHLNPISGEKKNMRPSAAYSDKTTSFLKNTEAIELSHSQYRYFVSNPVLGFLNTFTHYEQLAVFNLNIS